MGYRADLKECGMAPKLAPIVYVISVIVSCLSWKTKINYFQSMLETSFG